MVEGIALSEISLGEAPDTALAACLLFESVAIEHGFPDCDSAGAWLKAKFFAQGGGAPA